MSEAILQQAVARFLDTYIQTGEIFWFHCPNSIHTSKAQAGKHKSYGMKAGVPDLIIFGKGPITVCIELKTLRGSLSPAQKTVQASLKTLGILIYTIKTDCPFDAVKQVREILRDLGVIND